MEWFNYLAMVDTSIHIMRVIMMMIIVIIKIQITTTNIKLRYKDGTWGRGEGLLFNRTILKEEGVSPSLLKREGSYTHKRGQFKTCSQIPMSGRAGGFN
jgi:hypothetical protein